MISLSNKSIWLLIILVSLSGIYILYNNYYTDDNINFINNDEKYRKRKYPKYTKSKIIYLSPKVSQNIRNNSIKLMKQLLEQKLNAPKKITNKPVSTNKLIPVGSSNTSNTKEVKNNPAKKYIIKLYYTDWCPHCDQFKPVWYKLKSRYSDLYEFVDVNCTTNSPNLPFVDGYPTISIFNMNGEYMNNYEEDRSYESMETYLNLLE